MEHGNKKYNFEALRKAGDEISVKPANIYSLKNLLRKYAKANNIEYATSFSYLDGMNGDVVVRRIA
jgi:hypothetical protein